MCKCKLRRNMSIDDGTSVESPSSSFSGSSGESQNVDWEDKALLMCLLEVISVVVDVDDNVGMTGPDFHGKDSRGSILLPFGNEGLDVGEG